MAGFIRVRYWPTTGQWKDDPVAFAEQALGVTTWDRQRQLLRAMAQYPRVALRAGRKVSTSFTAAILALWWPVRYPDGRVIITAPTNRQVKDEVYGDLRMLLARSKDSTDCTAFDNSVAGTACGDSADDDCTDPDTCDGSGSCQDNHELDGTPCTIGTCEAGHCVNNGGAGGQGAGNGGAGGHVSGSGQAGAIAGSGANSTGTGMNVPTDEQEKGGGCGCRVTTCSKVPDAKVWLLLAVGLSAARRPRRARAVA